MPLRSPFTLAAGLLLALPAAAVADPFRDGDRVVLLGNTLIEREQESGYWEVFLTLAHPGKSLQFRNLGWSGDTVWAESRGMFDPPRQGYERMLELVRELEPDVILLGYGGVEAFGGPEGLPRFEEQYQKLVDDLSATKSRLIHLSPLLMEFESLPVQSAQSLEHAKTYNGHVRLYAGVMRRIAGTSGGSWIDLAEFQRRRADGRPLTDNGIHLSAEGYRTTGAFLAGKIAPSPPVPGGEVLPRAGLEELRQAVVQKNRLFFHRWRPQNFTYLFGFRKHEQGQNAAEIAEFDPLIAAAERRISRLRRRAVDPIRN